MQGIGAGAGGADALMEVLRQKLAEVQVRNQAKQAAERMAIEQQRMAQDDRQFGVTSGQADRRIGLDERKLGEDSRQFDVSAGQRDRTIKLDEGMQPVRIANVQAQTGEIQRKPQAEQEERDYTTSRDQTRHGYDMQQIAAQGQNALRIANVRHPDGSGPAAAAASQKEQNDIEDALGIIQQLREDSALSSSTGPLQGRGLGALAGIEGYTRVKAKHDNLVNKLALAQAGKLKGQGQISNMEREMLQKAATALTRTLGDADYLKELGNVEAQFKRMLPGPRVEKGTTPAGGSGFRVVEIK